jgi:epoxyqueuosine reductase
VCPTRAFPEPYVVDSRRCISYLTIELREAIPENLRGQMQNWIFGCDACQAVCPWVHRFARPGQERWLAFHPETCAPFLPDLLALDEAGFLQRFQGTPVMRAKRTGLLRNAAVALGNSGCAEAEGPLTRALEDQEPLVREHARWALERLRSG